MEFLSPLLIEPSPWIIAGKPSFRGMNCVQRDTKK